MKKILLLGDSIRMGYEKFVKDILKDTCDVYFSEENGRFAAFTLWQVNQFFKKHGKFDVVHWNNGYWDMNIEHPMTEPIHPIDEYIHFLKRIIAEIRRNGAEIIFATTIPIYEDSTTPQKTNYINDWVVKYNDAAKKLMAEENITVNDLYSLMLKGEKYYKSDDMLHLTDEGYRVCAEQVAKIIREKL